MFESHRIWHFIKTAKENKLNSIAFYYPKSKYADVRYAKLQDELREKGYIISKLTPDNVQTTQLMAVSNILGVK